MKKEKQTELDEKKEAERKKEIEERIKKADKQLGEFLESLFDEPAQK